MLLACDTGNSSTNFGLFDGKGNIYKTARIDTSRLNSVGKLKKFLSENMDLKKINRVSVSSVVPWTDPIFLEFFSKIKITPFFILPFIKLNVKICIEEGEKLGSDRIANICYAYSLSQKFQLVIDMGTALTIDVIDGKGDFLGGIIYPGIPLLANCLYQSTEKLPLVEIAKTKSIIGVNTEKEIITGIYNGNIFIIEGFINRISDYYNRGKTGMDALFTGGNSGLFFKEIETRGKKTLDPDLTLKGIKFLYDLNVKN